MAHTFENPIAPEIIAKSNERLAQDHANDLDAVSKQLERRGFEIESLVRSASEFELALPSWGFSQGGTRFGRFPAAAEPATVEEKLVAASWINDLTRITPRVSLHIPWDTAANPAALKKHARKLGLGFDAMNSNTFQD